MPKVDGNTLVGELHHFVKRFDNLSSIENLVLRDYGEDEQAEDNEQSEDDEQDKYFKMFNYEKAMQLMPSILLVVVEQIEFTCIDAFKFISRL